MNTCLKVLLTSVVTLGVLFQGCNKNPTTTSEEHEEYFVSVVNKNSTEISGFYLEMVGSEEIFDTKSAIKQGETQRITFALPALEEEVNPISRGDYVGYYTQNGCVKDIAIFNYEHNFCEETTITIRGESYQVSFSDLLENK